MSGSSSVIFPLGGSAGALGGGGDPARGLGAVESADVDAGVVGVSGSVGRRPGVSRCLSRNALVCGASRSSCSARRGRPGADAVMAYAAGQPRSGSARLRDLADLKADERVVPSGRERSPPRVCLPPIWSRPTSIGVTLPPSSRTSCLSAKKGNHNVLFHVMDGPCRSLLCRCLC